MLLAEQQAPAAKRPVACRHCGAPLSDPRHAGAGFCCAGCAYVHRLIHEHGLDAYYRLKDAVTVPADGAVFEPRDYGWLAEQQSKAEAEAGEAIPSLVVDLQGMSCAGCVWLVERVFQQSAGSRDIVVNAQLGSARIRWMRGAFDAPAWARKLQSLGYLIGPAGEETASGESVSLTRRVGLCGAFMLNVMLFALPAYFGMRPDFAYAGLFRILSLLLATLSVLVGGTYFIGRAWSALRAGSMHIDLPIALGIVGAYAATVAGWLTGSSRFFYADFVATFVFLMLVGRWAQVSALERNRRRLLRQQSVGMRVRTPDGSYLTRQRIEAGQLIQIGPGEMLPVDGLLEGACAAFSLASISGEADATVFNPGQQVPAGAVNLDRSDARLRTLQPWSRSLLAQLLAPAERTDHRHRLMEAVVRGYVGAILVLSTLSAAGWWYATGDLGRAGAVGIAVLVVSCPCAIGIALPLADEMATAMLRRRGLFVKEGDLWARLSDVRKIVFDKTGTLTLENPELRNPEAIAGLGATERSALLALVQSNLHPVGRCLHEALLAAGPASALEGAVHEEVGSGVWIGPWSLGRSGWKDAGPASPRTVLAHEGRVVAGFEFSDAVRPGAADELRRLTRSGYEIYILSGDRREKVEGLARELGIPAERALAQMSPEQKADWMRANGSRDALMLGDGANDSLAFDGALCRGTPVIHRGVLEAKADFYYLRRGISGVRELLEMARRHRHTQACIIAFSILYNLGAFAFAAAGMANPLVAAIIMPSSSLVSLGIAVLGMGSGRGRA